MKRSENFILREILDESILVPVGEAAARLNGMASMNEVGCLIFKALEQEQTEEDLMALLCSTYQVDEETARRDLGEFLDQLRRIGALVE